MATAYTCKEDLGPIPPPGKVPIHMFTTSDKNVSCIGFKGGIQFKIPYMSENGNAIESIALPNRYTVSGDCNTTLNGYYSQKIVIGFYNSWKLTIYFSSDVQQNEILARENVTKYHISQIELDYDFNNNLFTNAVDKIVGTKNKAVATNLNTLSTDEDKSYMCKKNTSFNIQNGLSMIIKELQFQAFKNESSPGFSSAVNCKDSGDNYVLLISTGAALGGLLLLVVVLGIVHVHKKRQSYQRITF
ncbi:uncharacterized protein LOC134255656 [Saccostrea cucullata]|uniref:uncharacterized protein LOC134255656 n=1 Tax=Saccostrea cuccullata TaxID=36930 RepID=UPI002ED26DF5